MIRREERVSSEELNDGRHARSRATRERILLAAERLFAESGIANVSLRDVGVAADQKNNMVVQYHFGDRDNLILQIIIYRGGITENVRLGLLAKIMSGKKRPQVCDYVRIFVISLASSLSAENYFLRFLSRLVVERGGIPNQTVPQGSIDMMRKVMRELLPHLPDAVIEQRWQILMASAVHMLASYQAAQASGTLRAPFDELLDDLVDFLTAGLSARYRASNAGRRASQKPPAVRSAPGLGVDATPRKRYK
jgi:AcrR family transcriptional regulator